MNEHIETLIKELKSVVMDLHRSAGVLDNIVQSLESEGKTCTDEKYLKLFINAQRLYRKDYKRATFENLEKKEDDIWNRINEAISEIES